VRLRRQGEKWRRRPRRKLRGRELQKKRRMVEYLQWLQNKVLEEEAALLERAEESQVVGSKYKKITTRDEEGQRPSKKARGKQPEKYYRGATVRWGVLTPVRGV